MALYAAMTDGLGGRIPDALTWPAIGGGLLIGAAAGEAAFANSLAGLFTAALVYALLWELRAIGAGDVKLMAAIGALKGLPFVVTVSFGVIGFGAAASLAMLAWRSRVGGDLRLPLAPIILASVACGLYLEAIGAAFTLDAW